MAGKAQKGKKKKRNTRAVVVLAVLAITLFIAGGMMAHEHGKRAQDYEAMRQVVEIDTFYPGISVGGIDLQGLTYEQGLALIQAEEQRQIEAYVVTITVDGREYKEILPTTSNALASLDQAYQFGRMGDLDVRYQEIQSLAVNKREFPIELRTDPSRLSALVNSIGDTVDVEAVDATVLDFDRETKTFTFTDESQGQKLDREGLMAQIDAAVGQGQYPIDVSGVINVVEPAITREQLSSRNKLLASFTTKTTSDADRNSNIKLCSQAFNGAVIMPGETFSLNEKTGVRTAEKGYKDAGAIKNGKLIPEPGGGVCQVSTTLFNAIVRTGVEIVERNNHSYPISYVPRGMDAMIDYQSAKDFKFTNVTPGPMYLISHFANQELTIEVYGEPILEEGITIDLRAETTEEIEIPATIFETDYSLLPGEVIEERTGRKGYRVTTYIQYKRGETVEKEEVLFKSYYTPYAPIIRQGPPFSGLVDIPIIDMPQSDVPIIQ